MSYQDEDDSKFSPRELKFLELYFSGALMKDAAKAAGYKGSSDQALCNTGRAILTKYEETARPNEIFRRVGASETRIAQLLLNLAESAESESARVNALGILSKCLGLQREQADPVQGARIVIQGSHRDDDKGTLQKVGCPPSMPKKNGGHSDVGQNVPRQITR